MRPAWHCSRESTSEDHDQFADEDAESEEERLGELGDSESDWSGAKGDNDPPRPPKRQRQIRPSARKVQGRPPEQSKARLKRLVKRKLAPGALPYHHADDTSRRHV